MEYSAVGRLCARHGFARAETLLLMFESYFDDSADETGRAIVVVSGWAATAESWLKFENEWAAYLKNHGLDSFHMNEFGKNGKHADKWGSDPKTYCDFLLAGAAIIRKYVNFGISRGIFLEEYEAASRECEIKSKIGPAFSICSLLAACRAQKRGLSAGFKAEDIRHYFDDPGSGKGKPELTKLFEDFLRGSPKFEDGKAREKPKQIQAADFLAWEHRFALQRYLEFGPLDAKQIHRSMRSLNSIPNDSQMLAGVENIVAFCRNPRSLC